MIKTNKGETEIHGSTAELLADLAVIVHTLYIYVLIDQDGMKVEEAKRVIMEHVERGMMTMEQLERVHDAKKAKARHGLLGMLNAMAEILKRAAEDEDDNNT